MKKISYHGILVVLSVNLREPWGQRRRRRDREHILHKEKIFYVARTHLYSLRRSRAHVLSLNRGEGGGWEGGGGGVGGGGGGGGKLDDVVGAVLGAVHADGQLPIVAWEKFWKFSGTVYLRYKATVESTFSRFVPVIFPRQFHDPHVQSNLKRRQRWTRRYREHI